MNILDQSNEFLSLLEAALAKSPEDDLSAIEEFIDKYGTIVDPFVLFSEQGGDALYSDIIAREAIRSFVFKLSSLLVSNAYIKNPDSGVEELISLAAYLVTPAMGNTQVIYPKELTLSYSTHEKICQLFAVHTGLISVAFITAVVFTNKKVKKTGVTTVASQSQTNQGSKQ